MRQKFASMKLMGGDRFGWERKGKWRSGWARHGFNASGILDEEHDLVTISTVVSCTGQRLKGRATAMEGSRISDAMITKTDDISRVVKIVGDISPVLSPRRFLSRPGTARPRNLV